MLIELNSPAWFALQRAVESGQSFELGFDRTGRGDDVLMLNARQHFVTNAAAKRYSDRLNRLNLQDR